MEGKGRWSTRGMDSLSLATPHQNLPRWDRSNGEHGEPLRLVPSVQWANRTKIVAYKVAQDVA